MRILHVSVLALCTVAPACRRSAPPAQPTPPQAATPGSVPTPTAPMVVQPVGTPAPGTAAAPAVVAPPANVPAGQPVPPAQVAGQQTTIGPLVITTSNPVLFRWTDGDWVARITVTVRNTGAAPVDVDRSSFRLPEWQQWGGQTDFPDHSSVNPGITIQGDMAWYLNGGQPQPSTFTVNYAPGENDEAAVLGSRVFTPVFSPAPPAHGAVPTALVYSLPINVAQPGLTFVHTDGDRAARIAFSITNNTGAPLTIPTSYFHGVLDGDDGSGWGPLTSFEDPMNIAPGATVSGTVGWYWSGAHGNPTALTFRFGPPNSPQLNTQVAIATGPSPIQ